MHVNFHGGGFIFPQNEDDDMYCAHLAAAYPHHIPYIEAVLGESEGLDYGGYEVKNGMMALPDRPGFGMDLIWAPEV